MIYFPPEIWMIVVPLAIVWLLVQGAKGLGKQLGSSADVTLRNMRHGDSPIRVVSAWRSSASGEYCANVWRPEIKRCVTLRAKSKKELEDIVDRQYQEYDEYEAKD